MDQERRGARRARAAGVRVRFESASGESVETEALDIGAGGVFLSTAHPAAVGKRLSLEVRVATSEPYAALGRVVWTRETQSDAGPPGMGVRFIDLDDTARAGIERLVDARAPRALAPAAPARERTMLGVGDGAGSLGPSGAPAPPGPVASAAPTASVASAVPTASVASAVPAAPIVSVMPPSRERTVLGVGNANPARTAPRATRERSVQEPPPEGWDLPEEPAPAEAVRGAEQLAERSVPIDLVAKKRDTPAVVNEAPVVESERPRRRSRAPVLLLVVAVAGVATYALRDRIPWAHLRSLVGADAPTSPH